MSFRAGVQDAAWIVCGIYTTIPAFWMLVHPFVDRWRAARVKFKLLGAWWIVLWCAAWAITGPWRHAFVLPDASLPIAGHPVGMSSLWVLAPLFWAGSYFLYARGGARLSLRRLIGAQEVDAPAGPNVLVTSGIYGRVRNPIYVGHICTMLGWSFAASTTACWAMTAFYVLTLLMMLPMEERELRQRFGAEYEEYCRRVPRLIPRF